MGDIRCLLVKCLLVGDWSVVVMVRNGGLGLFELNICVDGMVPLIKSFFPRKEKQRTTAL